MALWQYGTPVLTLVTNTHIRPTTILATQSADLQSHIPSTSEFSGGNQTQGYPPPRLAGDSCNIENLFLKYIFQIVKYLKDLKVQV